VPGPTPNDPNVKPARKIFISYRRTEASFAASQLREKLAEKFGADNLFIDVDSGFAGRDFGIYVRSTLRECDVFLALIGPQWLEARDDAGRPRLEQENDWVRLEIVAALERDIPVIPLLLEETKMPDAGKLPLDLQPLVRRHALRLRSGPDFAHDVSTLGRAIERTLSYVAPAPPALSPQVPWAPLASPTPLAASAPPIAEPELTWHDDESSKRLPDDTESISTSWLWRRTLPSVFALAACCAVWVESRRETPLMTTSNPPTVVAANSAPTVAAAATTSVPNRIVSSSALSDVTPPPQAPRGAMAFLRPVGADARTIRSEIGSPASTSPGYFGTTTVDRYVFEEDGRELNYIFDSSSWRIRQVELSGRPLTYDELTTTVSTMIVPDSLSETVRQTLLDIQRGKTASAKFRTTTFEGQALWRSADRFYVAVWEPHLHKERAPRHQ
jgi:hypothetical protein